MLRSVLCATGLIVLCLYGVSCGRQPTPSLVSEQSFTVSISAANNQTQITKGEETRFFIEIDPSSLKGQVADVNVFGDRGIECVQSEGDMWTWYCIGTQETEATVFAEVTGNLPVKMARYGVKVVAPTPTPTDTPIPTPTELPVTDTLMPTDTPTPPPTEPSTTDTPAPTGTPAPTPTEPLVTETPTPTDVINGILVGEPPTIDGRLDEHAWSDAQPLTYAMHPWENDLTTAAVRLLWDDKYLYAGFDVSDTQVESSSIDNKHDSDSVSVIIENGGQIQEYRYSLPADRAGTTSSKSKFKGETGATILNDPSNQDDGYSVEMRIDWAMPVTAGDVIAADFLSVDHDYNPGKRYDDPDTEFSKISWDRDQNVDTAMNSILLSTSTELSATGTPTPTATATNTPTPAPTLCSSKIIGESGVYCTDNGSGGTEILAVHPPRTVARLRIDMTRRETEYGDSLWEVEAYGPDTGDRNLVKGGRADPSSVQDNETHPGRFAAENAIDGDDTNTRWSSDWEDPQWLDILLPDPQVVNCIVLKWEAAYASEYCVTVTVPVAPGPCPYQANTDAETIIRLIQAEEQAVLNEDISIIQAIFAADARIWDVARDEHWDDPIARYAALFANTDFVETAHFEIQPAGPGIAEGVAYFTSGSKDEFISVDNLSQTHEFDNVPGSDHWTFDRNSAGCWVITNFTFNASHIPFPP